MSKASFRDQAIALPLTFVTCAVLVLLLWGEIHLLNQVSSEKIAVHLRVQDIVVGLTIYLKTAIDFAIFIGRLMDRNRGLKGRIGIEIGTALGNAVGTFAILAIWTFFKEINWLLGIMVFIAGLVLFRLAEEGLEHVHHEDKKYPAWFRSGVQYFETAILFVNRLTHPLLSRVMPSTNVQAKTQKTFGALLMASFLVPFVLGLDDFAGYVPLFNVVNVFGFATGVFLGHMILNIFLYLSPSRTIKAVKNPIISLLGSIAFVILGIWGLVEAFKLLFLHH